MFNYGIMDAMTIGEEIYDNDIILISFLYLYNNPFLYFLPVTFL